MRNTLLHRLTVIVSAFVLSSAASADCQRLVATNDPALPNQFTLDFGPYGGPRQAAITRSEITVNECADVGQASFLDYYQEVDPLLLPGDVSTGDLTIRISQSTPVTYDPASGTFTTNDFYAIYFTGDLSVYGITSPFYLPGASNGQINFATATTGTIQMLWDGSGQLPNPFDPEHPITFTYACQVNTQFVVNSGCATSGCEAGDLDGDCTVGISDLSTLLAHFGASGPRVRPADGDVNGDLAVDLGDLALVLSQFGNSCN